MVRVKTGMALLLVVIGLSVACLPKDLPPDVKPAFTANEILIRVDELQKTVIAAFDSTPRGISKERADLIVRFTVDAAKVLREVPVGWQSSVKAAWNALKTRIGTPESQLQTLWSIVDRLITALQPV